MKIISDLGIFFLRGLCVPKSGGIVARRPGPGGLTPAARPWWPGPSVYPDSRVELERGSVPKLSECHSLAVVLLVLVVNVSDQTSLKLLVTFFMQFLNTREKVTNNLY